MDDKGYLNVRALTCAQLANTFQEDADFLGAWYSGWWNGHLKRHSVNVARAKQGIHEVIVYCKANPDDEVVDAVDAYVKKVQAGAVSTRRMRRRFKATAPPGLRAARGTSVGLRIAALPLS